MDRRTELMEFVKNDLLHGRKANLRDDEDLLSAGIIDSLGILQLVGFVKKRFGVQVPDEDVVYENFHSIKALSDYLERT